MTAVKLDYHFDVTGMTCGGCAKKIATGLQGVDGVSEASVTLSPPQAHVRLVRPVAPDVLSQTVQALGRYGIIEVTGPKVPAPVEIAEPPQSLFPLFLIVGYIAGTVVLIALAGGNRSVETMMTNFMAGFFLVFSFFKLLDLKGFIDAYKSYDLLARHVPGWSAAYPVVELALGIAYLTRLSPFATNAVTLVLMLAGSVGVLKALLDKRTILCACLGTALKLPMTKVTLVEDLGMAAMAAIMLGMMAMG